MFGENQKGNSASILHLAPISPVTPAFLGSEEEPQHLPIAQPAETQAGMGLIGRGYSRWQVFQHVNSTKLCVSI